MIYHVSSLVIIASLADPHLQRMLRGHTAQVTCLAQSVDGRYLASGQAGPRGTHAGEAPVIVWSYEDAAGVMRLLGLRGAAVAVSFSPDNRFVAASDTEKSLLVWDTQNGQVVVATRHEQPVTCVAWGPVHARASKHGASRSSVYELGATAGHVVKEMRLEYNLRSMQFDLVSKAVAMPSVSLRRAYNVAVYSDDGRFLLAGTRSGELCVFRMAGAGPQVGGDGAGAGPGAVGSDAVFRACVPVSAGEGGLMALAVHGDEVYTAGADGVVKRLRGGDQSIAGQKAHLVAGTARGKIYTVAAVDLTPKLLRAAHTAPVTSLAFGAGSDRVATASEDGSVRLWDLERYEELWAVTRAHHAPTAISMARDQAPSRRDGDLVVSGWDDGAVYCHDPGAGTASGPPLWALPQAHPGPVSVLRLAPFGLLTAGEDGKLRVWTLTERHLVAEFAEHSKKVTALCVDPAKPSVVHTGSLDQTCVAVNVARKRRIAYHSLRVGHITAMDQRAEGENEIVAATHDGSIYVFDIDEAGAGRQRPAGVALMPPSRGCMSAMLTTFGRPRRPGGPPGRR